VWNWPRYRLAGDNRVCGPEWMTDAAKIQRPSKIRHETQKEKSNNPTPNILSRRPSTRYDVIFLANTEVTHRRWSEMEIVVTFKTCIYILKISLNEITYIHIYDFVFVFLQVPILTEAFSQFPATSGVFLYLFIYFETGQTYLAC
jgi:hypothetical protein